MLEEPDEDRGGRHRIVIGSATVKNARLLFDCQLARLEARKELSRGEPRGEHPIRPCREGAQQAVNRDWPISVEVKPVSEGVDVISGGTRAESPPSNR